MTETQQSELQSSNDETTQNITNDNESLFDNEATNSPLVTATTNQPTTLAGLPERKVPLSSPIDDGSVEMLYNEAIKLENIDESAVFDLIDSVGRGGKFVPNEDVSRAVKTYLPKKGEFIQLPLGRNSESVS